MEDQVCTLPLASACSRRMTIWPPSSSTSSDLAKPSSSAVGVPRLTSAVAPVALQHRYRCHQSGGARCCAGCKSLLKLQLSPASPQGSCGSSSALHPRRAACCSPPRHRRQHCCQLAESKLQGWAAAHPGRLGRTKRTCRSGAAQTWRGCALPSCRTSPRSAAPSLQTRTRPPPPVHMDSRSMSWAGCRLRHLVSVAREHCFPLLPGVFSQCAVCRAWHNNCKCC